MTILAARPVQNWGPPRHVHFSRVTHHPSCANLKFLEHFSPLLPRVRRLNNSQIATNKRFNKLTNYPINPLTIPQPSPPILPDGQGWHFGLVKPALTRHIS
jgi:hypothetical protein